MEKAPVAIKLNVPKAEAEAMKKQIEAGENDQGMGMMVSMGSSGSSGRQWFNICCKMLRASCFVYDDAQPSSSCYHCLLGELVCSPEMEPSLHACSAAGAKVALA